MSFERKQCIVKSCDRKNTRKFSLPSDTEGAKLWLELLGRKDLENHRNTSNLRVCEAHFAPHMMTASGKRLVQWAIPYKVIKNENNTTEETVIETHNNSVNDKQHQQEQQHQQQQHQLQQQHQHQIQHHQQAHIQIKKVEDNSAVTTTTATTTTVKPQIISINHIPTTTTTTSINNFIKQENHQDVTEVLNFEIKEDGKSVIEKATIIKDGSIVGKIDGIEIDKEVQTVIETLKVETPQIITINPGTIQTMSQIHNANHHHNHNHNHHHHHQHQQHQQHQQQHQQQQHQHTVVTSTMNSTTTSPLKNATTKTIVVSAAAHPPATATVTNQKHTSVTTATASAVAVAAKKRKLIVHNNNKNKIRKSDLINLAHQAINEAKNPPSKDEDQFDLIGKRIAIDLRHMDGRQKAIAEKLVNDVIYYGKIGQLRETSSFNPFYSSAPTAVVSTAPTVIQTAVQANHHPQHHQQQQLQPQHQQNHNHHHHQQHQQQQQQQTTRLQTIPSATITTPVVAAASSSQTITIPPVGSLITATPIVSSVQVAGTNQIIYTVSNQNAANPSTISINGQAVQAEQASGSNANDKCQWWSARNLAYM